MNEEHKPVKTRWGCLAVPIAIAIILVIGQVRSMWYERQPLSRHLRDVFTQSGFHIPEYVTEIEGEKGLVDFHGDYVASVSFTVLPDDIEKFMHLPEKTWKNPADFKPLTKEQSFEKWKIPAGAFMIEERRPEMQATRKYAVDRKSNRVYFYRAST
jgi:hypothetical protein